MSDTECSELGFFPHLLELLSGVTGYLDAEEVTQRHHSPNYMSNNHQNDFQVVNLGQKCCILWLLHW